MSLHPYFRQGEAEARLVFLEAFRAPDTPRSHNPEAAQKAEKLNKVSAESNSGDRAENTEKLQATVNARVEAQMKRASADLAAHSNNVDYITELTKDFVIPAGVLIPQERTVVQGQEQKQKQEAVSNERPTGQSTSGEARRKVEGAV
ncbi:hypothetical protein EXS70_04850 [Candidatus Peribacteria bacterium]|nr:hypothetical protein [Candidatus Peribacteria bacterium]